MKVKDILRGKPDGVITISQNQTLHEASQLLSKHRIGVLVVVDAKGKLIGILSERDIVRNIATHGAQALGMPVKDMMTTDLIIALPNDDLDYVSNTMTNKRIRHLPVMEDKNLIGIISIGDVVKAQMQFYEGEARSLMKYISGEHA